eukprot:Gregarina_sp_Poly_1__5861@NODE_308_length_9647_cov_165_896660_g265_i0_p4_GENE_NODE_308_length_9647_cov_165_896660_g265_i0NODE_308_length_9647_cov_165_896660_g265_i0_p4_ORF_typecomplete_len238_score19_09SOXp/PF12336_8/3_4e02SOXp/PF12336_8/0_37_NODE_308_length_9647_cov_165_896660_g265_i081378850
MKDTKTTISTRVPSNTYASYNSVYSTTNIRTSSYNQVSGQQLVHPNAYPTAQPSQYLLPPATNSYIPNIQITPPGQFKPSPLKNAPQLSSKVSPREGEALSYVFSPSGLLERTEANSEPLAVDAHSVSSEVALVPDPTIAAMTPVATMAPVANQTPITAAPGLQRNPHQQLAGYNPIGYAGMVPQYGGYPQVTGMQPMVYPVAGPTQLIYDIYDVEDMIPYQQEHWRAVAFHYRSAE